MLYIHFSHIESLFPSLRQIPALKVNHKERRRAFEFNLELLDLDNTHLPYNRRTTARMTVEEDGAQVYSQETAAMVPWTRQYNVRS